MKNAKLFGKISLIDLVVILLIAVLLIGVGVRFISFSGKDVEESPAASKTTSVSCEVTIRFEEISAALRKEPVAEGDVVTFGGKRFGKIKSFSKSLSPTETKLADGTTVFANAEDEYTYLVTISVTLEQGEDGLLRSSSGKAIAIGTTGTWSTRLFSHEGTVIRVEKTQ